MTEREQRTDKNLTSTRTSTRSSTTTTTTAHAPGRVRLQPLDWEQIRQAYVDVLGALNSIKARDIEEAVENGLQASAILDAIEQTAMAPRPTHYYLRAILNRYARWGIFSGELAEKDRNERKREQRLANLRKEEAWYNS